MKKKSNDKRTNERCFAMVHMLKPNRKMALHTINTEMVSDDLNIWNKAAPRPRVDVLEGQHTFLGSHRDVRATVDQFMTNYPRGAGTSGDLRLRALYAACYALKTADFVAPSSIRMADFSDRSLRYLVGFEPTARASGLYKDQRVLKRLFDQGVLNGYFYEDGRMADHWLTDLGIRVADLALMTLDKRKVDEAIKKQETISNPTEADYVAARNAIKSFSGHDAKSFVENAKRVSEVFNVG